MSFASCSHLYVVRWVWWFALMIPALRRLRQEDHHELKVTRIQDREFEVSLSYQDPVSKQTKNMRTFPEYAT